MNMNQKRKYSGSAIRKQGSFSGWQKVWKNDCGTKPESPCDSQNGSHSPLQPQGYLIMAGNSTTQRVRNMPLVLVETENLSREEWLAYRRRGIGGSDAAAIFGISPFRTARDLYYDKLDIVSVEDDEGNWVAMEMGNLLEPLVAKIFARKTGYKVYQVKKMFQHPANPFILADVDYFVELPDGDLIIDSARRHFGPANPDAPAVELNASMEAKVLRYLQLQEEKKSEEVHSKQIEKEMKRLKGMLVAEMGASCTAVCKSGGQNYTITYNPVYKPTIDKDGLLRLKLQYPDIYEQFVTVSESRRFYVKAAVSEAA